MPESLKTEPVLDDILENALNLFFLLSPGRAIGLGGVGGISTADIMAVADESGYDPVDWLHLCRAMDSAYMAHVNKPKSKTK